MIPATSTTGAIARKLAADIKKGGGIITEGDLADYEVKERQPLFADYQGFHIVTAPPPSSGGIAIIESLNILRSYDLSHLGDRTAPKCTWWSKPIVAPSWTMQTTSAIPITPISPSRS